LHTVNEFSHVCSMIIQNSCVPFIAFYPDGRMMASNPAFHGLTDYSGKELEDLKMPDAIMPQEWRWIFSEVKGRLECTGKPCPFECEIMRKGGSHVPVEVFAHEECDTAGNVLYYYAFIHDISSRKHAEEELKRSEEKYKMVFDSANDSIVIQDVDTGKVFDLNRASWEMYGYTREGYLDLRPEDFNCGTPPYTVENAQSRIARAASGEPQLFEWHAKRSNGELFWVEINLKRIAFGDQPRLLAIVRDITQRKHAEEEADEARSRAELYLDLMSHDINNLNQIGLGYLELAMDNPGLDAGTRELLAKPFEVLKNSSRLIDNVRKIQQLKEKTVPLKAVELRPVLGSVIAQHTSVPGRDVLIHFTPISECSVMADDLIADVFSNIVGNAIKHSAGPLTIDIRMSQSMINGKGWCRVSIEDDGPGIPDRLKEKIFNRADKSKMKPNGRGLGLYLVKLLVENYNGKVWVEDRIRGDPTKGCRFVVMLTVVKD
jgi:PAS domain S-box-containing protein